ncbi:hypothetical protein RUM43_004257 [Polyplax serrata]|uniref:Uncharacterized protein n=1 Tax=Polyplax serrata TaxID=468196 RepID=A0AAN8SBY7_POLSC
MQSSQGFRVISQEANQPGIVKELEDIITPTNNVLSKYCSEVQFNQFSYYYNLHNFAFSQRIDGSHRKDVLPEIYCDNIVMCEQNVELWDKAFMSALHSLSENKCIDSSIVLQFINYLMNAPSKTDFSSLKQFLHLLLLIHPPRNVMFQYYTSILSDTSIAINDKCIEEQQLLDCVLDALINCLEDYTSDEKNESERNYTSTFSELANDSNFNSVKCSFQRINFNDLRRNEKVDRCLLVLNFLYNILETDFFFWLKSKQEGGSHNTLTRPLMSSILWPKRGDVGLCNKKMIKILKLFILGRQLDKYSFIYSDITKKYINLLAEVIRSSDESVEMFPYVGTKANDLVRNLAVMLHELLENFENVKQFTILLDYISSISIPWLRLHVCSHLLSYVTGYQCSPELIAAYDLLEHATYIEYEESRGGGCSRESSGTVDWKRVQRLRRLTSVNTKRKGRTRLQTACEGNDLEEVRALLTFPELDINVVDHEGWTALHLATKTGSVQCVRELLKNHNSDTRKCINIRCRGPENITPLMCAAVNGHAEICHLLLEHSGPALLEDVNDSNKTALDVSGNDEVTRILSHYKKNSTLLERGRLDDVYYEDKYKELVIGLCVEMILSYFNTHRTLEVWNEVSTAAAHREFHTHAREGWDYKRYFRDINNNIEKLRNLCLKLEHMKEFKFANEIFAFLLFNKFS